MRRSEAAALTWGDLQRWDDGSGRITVVRSKTDVGAAGAVVTITPAAMRALDAIRFANDFLGPDLLDVHCRCVNSAEIALLGQSGVKVANNAAIAARKGAAAPSSTAASTSITSPRTGASASSTAASSRSLSSSATTLTSTNTRTTSISPIGIGSTCGTG